MEEKFASALQITLQDYLARVFPERTALQVGEPVEIGAGWESELLAFSLEEGSSEARRRADLVLRLYHGEQGPAKAANEFRALSRLGRAGYPVPAVYHLETGSAPLGKPFILMEKIDGQSLWPVLARAGAAEQQALVERFIGLFVRLHALDWRAFVDDPAAFEPYNPHIFVDRWLATAQEMLRNHPHSGFEPLLGWLEGRREALACARPAPLHQDFHPNNILLRPDGTAVVIDWTSFEVSDPRFDLAWTLVLIYSYLGGRMREHFLSEYERQSGAAVENIADFEAIACARRLFDISVSLSAGAEQMGMRPEAVEAMRAQMDAHRRVYERLQACTGLRFPQLERVFSQGS